MEEQKIKNESVSKKPGKLGCINTAKLILFYHSPTEETKKEPQENNIPCDLEAAQNQLPKVEESHTPLSSSSSNVKSPTSLNIDSEGCKTEVHRLLSSVTSTALSSSTPFISSSNHLSLQSTSDSDISEHVNLESTSFHSNQKEATSIFNEPPLASKQIPNIGSSLGRQRQIPESANSQTINSPCSSSTFLPSFSEVSTKHATDNISARVLPGADSSLAPVIHNEDFLYLLPDTSGFPGGGYSTSTPSLLEQKRGRGRPRKEGLTTTLRKPR